MKLRPAEAIVYQQGRGKCVCPCAGCKFLCFTRRRYHAGGRAVVEIVGGEPAIFLFKQNEFKASVK